jgi:hypothetical protein
MPPLLVVQEVAALRDQFLGPLPACGRAFGDGAGGVRHLSGAHQCGHRPWTCGEEAELLTAVRSLAEAARTGAWWTAHRQVEPALTIEAVVNGG